MSARLGSHFATVAVLLGLAGVAAFPGCKSSGTRTPSSGNRTDAKSDFVSTPPAVESATIEAIDQPQAHANALLQIEFDHHDKRVGRRINLFEGDETITLRDDGREADKKAGDGIHSAFIQFDFTDAVPSDVELRELRAEEPSLVFQGRQIIGVEDKQMRTERFDRLSRVLNAGRTGIAAKFNAFDLVSSIRPSRIDPARSLVIIDPRVVQDPCRTFDPCTRAGNPNGVWTFKHLVTEMVAGTGVDPAVFVERWLKLWLTDQPVSSGFVAEQRSAMQDILDRWPKRNGKLDLNQSPFRLAAIVNRTDLAENLLYGPGSAGEGRFVFGVWDRRNGCSLLPFSIIFEYGIDKRNCNDLRNWARQWVALSALPLGSPEYNTALEEITEQFASANASPLKPNGSALNQLRTNENALNKLWELREFAIDARTHLLKEVTTKQTPDESLNRTAALVAFMTANASDILALRHVVPERFPGTRPFMAATSRASLSQLDTHFAGPTPNAVNTDVRHLFSLATCSACHIAETGTNVPGSQTDNAFLHIDPREMPAKLSRFMTGSTADMSDSPDPFCVRDPEDDTIARPFNDIERRRVHLAELAGSHCIRLALVPPLFERPSRCINVPLELLRDYRLRLGFARPLRMTH